MEKDTKQKLPRFTQLLQVSWQLYKYRFKALLGAEIIPIVILALLMTSVLSFVNNMQGTPLVNLGLAVIVLLSIIAFIIIESWSQLAILYLIQNSGEKLSIRNAYSKGSHQIASYIWISILIYLAILGGTLLLIIPGIIFSIWFSMTPFILVEEEKKGVTALKQSRYYTQGRRWQIFWRLFTLYFFVILITQIPGYAFRLYGQADIGNSIDYVLSVLISPLMTIFTYSIYHSLRLLKTEEETKKQG